MSRMIPRFTGYCDGDGERTQKTTDDTFYTKITNKPINV